MLRKFKIKKELLYRVVRNHDDSKKLLVCASKLLKLTILRELHIDLTSGHLGYNKDMSKFARDFIRHILKERFIVS